MPTSEKQKAANRRNAQKSTGPKTVEGKTAVSRNAIKHGLYSSHIVLNTPNLSEDRKQYQQLVDSLSGELKPEGILQDHLVLKIANALWRYQRVIYAETCTINRQLESTADHIQRGLYDRFLTDDDEDHDDREPDEESRERREADILGSNSMPSESQRDTLQRYEMRLDRQLTRAFHLLHLLQHPKKNKNTGNKPISNAQSDPAKPLPDQDLARNA